jgi:prepilin-type N-terminal cleavage/methylation domain-containing protein
MASFDSPQPPAALRRGAFSLVELLIVVAIIGLVMAFAVPAFQALKTANDLTSATNGVAGVLERARAYAMANNLYVYVGLVEVNADVAADAVPQTPATSSAGGRVVLATVASRDGTRGYDLLSSILEPAWTNYGNGSGLFALGRVETYENVHLAASLGEPPTTGPMARPSVGNSYRLGSTACKSVTPFAWPLGSELKPGQGQYFFEKVIQFDPQGVARIQYSTNQDNIVGWMEIGLQQTHGSVIPPVPEAGAGAVTAIQIDGMTGAVRTYRP